MSRQNVETLRKVMEEFNAGNWDGALAAFDPGVEWCPIESDPDQRPYRGHDGVRNFWQSWVDSFDGFRLIVADLVDAGDHAIALTRVAGQGRSSGIEATSFPFCQVAEFRAGRIVRWTMYPTLRAAQEALGLSGLTRSS